MTETHLDNRTFVATDGYSFHVAVWPADPDRPRRGQVVVVHGVQSHSGWYHGLGRVLASSGYTAAFPDRRGSGANPEDRGHTPSAGRLIQDLVEWLKSLRGAHPGLPTALAGISWGAKLVTIIAGRHPELVDAIALICPGLHPRLGVSPKERLRIAWAFLTQPRKTFPIPLSDPALFTGTPAGQAFIAADAFGLREGTASLLAASFVIDRLVRWSPGRIRQPALLMLASEDRIVDNDRTRAFFDRLASPNREIILYPGAHHTLEFEPDPTGYALDLVAWLDGQFPKPGGRPGDSDDGTDQAGAA